MEITEFTEIEVVEKAIKELKKRNTVVSDVLDDKGNQYVDLVQEGGGVLGIALVGYIYVLEEMGIRFANMAGASAGSITTLLLASLGNPDEKKSPKLIDLMANKNFYDFVDGSKSAKRLIKEVINKRRTPLLIWHGLWVYKNLYVKQGLNPGGEFFNWIKDILNNHGVNSTTDLLATMNGSLMLRLRNGINASSDFSNEIAIIASDLTTNTKAVFPKMSKLYYSNPKEVNPAEFVRASMAIPAFFEPHRVVDLPEGEDAICRWDEMAKYKGRIPKEIKFVDGGVMSNFPIDIFHRRNSIPRKPTLGVKLGLERVEPNEINNIFKGLYAAFDSARQIRDFEFIYNNQEFEKLVKYVDLREYNWLDFSLSDKQKVEIFTKGALAACSFLSSFDWRGYKHIREQLMWEEFKAAI